MKFTIVVLCALASFVSNAYCTVDYDTLRVREFVDGLMERHPYLDGGDDSNAPTARDLELFEREVDDFVSLERGFAGTEKRSIAGEFTTNGLEKRHPDAPTAPTTGSSSTSSSSTTETPTSSTPLAPSSPSTADNAEITLSLMNLVKNATGSMVIGASSRKSQLIIHPTAESTIHTDIVPAISKRIKPREGWGLSLAVFVAKKRKPLVLTIDQAGIKNGTVVFYLAQYHRTAGTALKTPAPAPSAPTPNAPPSNAPPPNAPPPTGKP